MALSLRQVVGGKYYEASPRKVLGYSSSATSFKFRYACAKSHDKMRAIKQKVLVTFVKGLLLVPNYLNKFNNAKGKRDKVQENFVQGTIMPRP